MGTILVVDDDEHIREFLRKSCAGLATVVEAADGAQAIAAARWSHPDLVVMDLDMPVIDGFEAARQIKADPTLGDPVLVALTGNETVNAVPRARAAGFSYFVRKETNARAFVDTVAGLLRDTMARSAVSAPEAAAAAVPAPEVAPGPPPRARRPRVAKGTGRSSPSKRAAGRGKQPSPRKKVASRNKAATGKKTARSSRKPRARS